MEYDQGTIDEMIDKIDLLEYASQFYDFKKDGDDWVTSCPNHSDSTPSLKITPSKNLFHCFGCGCGGTIIQWKETFEGCTRKQAIKEIQDLTGFEIKASKTPEALKIYKQFKNELNLEKAPDRKILDEKEIDRFDNEYPDEWISEGISEEALDKFNIRVDKRANRIIYPVYDDNFNLIGFKGRTKFAKFKEMGIAKYQNYNKIGTTDFFAGMKENVVDINKTKTVIVFEGIKSVMKAYDFGFKYCIASETSAMNEEQEKILIKRGIKNVVIAYDKGVSLSKIKKSCKLLLMFCNVFVVLDKRGLLDDKESPVDKGEEVFRNLLKEAIKI